MDEVGVRRFLWGAWAVTVALACAGILVRAMTGVHGSGDWFIIAAVAVMACSAGAIRRFRFALIISITMSTSGIGIGGVVGILARSLIVGSPLGWARILMWGLVGGLAMFIFLRQLSDLRPVRDGVEPELTPLDLEALRAMGPEERQAAMEKRRGEVEAVLAWSEEELRRMKTQFAYCGAILLLGFGVFIAVRLLNFR